MDRTALLAHFEWQAEWCLRLGSPLYGSMLTVAARDIRSGGPIAELLGDWTEDPQAAALALRIAGALKTLLHQGHLPAYADLYAPPFAGAAPGRLQALLKDAVAEHGEFIRTFITRPVQTNELARSSCLLGGFLDVAETTRLPLRLLEIGASCGLNLLWDTFHYDLMGLTWGPENSPVNLFIKWRGMPPALEAPVSVVSREGCDINPLNVQLADDLCVAEAYIWPEQADRLARFRAGAALARIYGILLEKADAAAWLERSLDAPEHGQCTVLFHSIMWHYMPLATQKRCIDLIEAAGARATRTAPLAWLRMEPERPDAIPEIRLTQWPGGVTRRLAHCHPHGADIEWRPATIAPPSSGG